MPYIGTSPSNGVRRVHTYTATASQTTFTGASSEGVTLSYVDTNYIDVFQNGVLLGSADYTSTSGTSVVLAQGASVDDLIVIVVYDVFSVADTVSKTNGGSFDSAVTMSNNLTVSGAFTSQGIDDNADATAITIDSSERVNIGTGTPPTTDSVLTVQKSSAANEFNVISSPSHASVVNLGDTDDYNICRIKSDNSDNSLQFQTNNSERMRMTSAGTIGIGDTTPTAFVDIACDTQQSHVLQLRNTNASTGGGKYIQFAKANGDFTGSVTQSSDLNTVAFNTTSDYRLKENISYDFDATSRLKQLKPARFNWISDENNTTIDGFIAHEVSGIVPEAISGEKDGTEDIGTIKDEKGKVLRTNVLEITKQDGETWTKTGTKNAYQGIDQSKLVPLLVKTIQELEARITALEKA